MVCDTCKQVLRTLGVQAVEDPSYIATHYSEYRQLESSADAGCRICALFRRVLLDCYAQELSLSTDQARLHHLAYDDATNPEDRMATDVLPLLTSSQLLKRAEYQYPLKVSIRWESLSGGLQGLYYLRMNASTDTALDGVFPYLHIASISADVKFPFSTIQVTGRAISRDPDFELAQSWIDWCLETHTHCKQLPETPLPTRVLDLRPLDSTQDLRLVLGNGQKGRYAALSHCWGKKRPMVLDSGAEMAFYERISFADLPPTFQDAVVAARNLKVNFLWIDSLCITQDSKKDWEEHCAKMASIYKNAFVTLAGPAAGDCYAGFLHSRPLFAQETLPSSDLTLCHYRSNWQYFAFGPEPNSPLTKRGWVMQERLLSPRILYFGSSGMYFECFEAVRWEHCHVPTMWTDIQFGLVTKLPVERLQSSTECFQYWRNMLETYSNMLLTKPTDRLPALSGLAFEISVATQADYLAGIWSQDLHLGLTWYIPDYVWALPSPVSLTQDYIAPSWSWASARHAVRFHRRYRATPFYSDLKILHASISLAGLDNFGAVKNGFINVRGRIVRVLADSRSDDGRLRVRLRDTSMQLMENQHETSAEYLRYFPDSKRGENDENEFELLLVYLLGYERDGGFPGGPAEHVALAIEATGHAQNEYRRIGVVHMDSFYKDEPFPKLFAHSEMHEIRLV